MNLKQLYDTHDGRSSTKWDHYFEQYDRYLRPYIGTDVTLFEIGVGKGGSLQLWKKYLGPNAKIVGVDYDQSLMFSEENITTYCGKQDDVNMWNAILEKHGRPDIVIDDGSHDQLDVLNTLSILYPKLKDKGLYVIEDTHTAYWGEWKGSINSPFNIVSILGKHAHDVNLQYMKEPYAPLLPDLKGISFCDSMIFLEKEMHKKREPYATKT
jgi:hypothetical protein